MGAVSDDRPPTFDETMRVRRQECRASGHNWDAIMRVGKEDPDLFVCSNCGRTLRVVLD